MSSPEADRRVLVIGYGNPLRGDDSVGWYAAQRLEKSLPAGAADVLTCHQLMPELAEPISQARLVVFIDASAADAPGRISEQVIEPADGAAMTSTHSFEPPALLACALRYFGRAPGARLFTVGGESFELSESLSPTVQAAADQLVRRIEEFVRSMLDA